MKKKFTILVLLTFNGITLLCQQWNGNSNPDDIIWRNGKVGIGTNTIGPDGKLQVDGDIISKGPWADARAFGAIGNDIHDDRDAIQTAIDSKGMAILGRKGTNRTFRIDSTLVLRFINILTNINRQIQIFPSGEPQGLHLFLQFQA